jgi:hypothetical protein
MSYEHSEVARPTTDTLAAHQHEHPRGRGFRILSRLAREQQQPAASAAPPDAPETVAPEVTLEDEAEAPSETAAVDVPDSDPVEWTAPVLLFDRSEPTPRHRRDVATEATRRSS